MNETEIARMVRFFYWLCDTKKISSSEAKNEINLLNEIVSRTNTKIASAAAALGYSRRCAIKLVKQDVFFCFRMNPMPRIDFLGMCHAFLVSIVCNIRFFLKVN